MRTGSEPSAASLASLAMAGFRIAGSVVVAVLAGSFALACAAPASAETLTVESGNARVSVGTQPWRIVFAGGDDNAVLTESGLTGDQRPGALGFRTELGWAHALRAVEADKEGEAVVATLATTDPLGRTIDVRIAPAGAGVISIEAEVTGAGGVAATAIGFDAPAGEGYFGFGERSNAVDQRGREVENYVSDGPFPEEDREFVKPTTPPWGARDRDDSTYYPVPWLLSSRGYGVLIDRDETSRFDLAAERADTWSLDVDGPRLDLRLFAGPTPAKALRRFTAATGRQPPAAAPWVYGPWFQTGQPNVIPLEEEAGFIRTLRDGDAPVSAAETQMHYLPCGAQRGRADYIAARTAQFHEAGFAHLGYFNPLLCVSYSEVYGPAAAAGVLQRDPATGQPFSYPAFVGGDGPAGFTEEPLAQFDFTAPGAESFYEGLVREAYDAGYDGWMEDFGEYTPPTAKSADGTPGPAMHNRYPVDYHCAMARIAARLERPLTRHQRSGWTGAARCANIVWGGDPTTRWGFDGLSSTITQGVGMGMSGVARWGSDIGGYFSFGAQGRPDAPEPPRLTPEMLIRWIEVGAVSPVMRTKRSGIAIPSYTRPQVFDPEILPYWRRYTKLHTQLYPYLRAADAEYRRTGMPIMRHGLLTHPGDRRAVAAHGQFMFGPSLLAAPVVAPDQVEQRVYAPRGRWLDFWRSLRFKRGSGGFALRRAALLRGRRDHTLPAPLAELPMLIRSGAVLPLLSPDVDTLADYGDEPGLVHLSDRRKRLRLLAFPRGRSSGALYAGERFVSRERKGSWTLRIAGRARRSYRVEATLATLRERLRPCAVSVGGRRLAPARWSFDARSRVLRARFKLRRGTLGVIGCGQGGDRR